MGEKKRLDLKNAATSKSRSVDDGEGRPYPPADRGTKTEVTGGHRVCGRHTVCAWLAVAMAVIAASVRVTGTGPGALWVLFMASDTCLATVPEIFCKTDADKSESSLSCMSALAAGKSSDTAPLSLLFSSIAVVSNKGSTAHTVWSSFHNTTSQKERVFQNACFFLFLFFRRETRFILGVRGRTASPPNVYRAGPDKIFTRIAVCCFALYSNYVLEICFIL